MTGQDGNCGLSPIYSRPLSDRTPNPFENPELIFQDLTPIFHQSFNLSNLI